MLQLNGGARLGRRILLVVAVVGIVLAHLMGYLYLRAAGADADSPGCRQVYMSPAYARLGAFDELHTALASKYSLYLYREQGQDAFPPEGDARDAAGDADFLLGAPVLFIPGNAGSYKQARLIALESLNLYYVTGQHRAEGQNLDFFTADFNEDFTAFHGRTIVDQAEYLNDAVRFILGLYARQRGTRPKLVILVGHSMGGVVARVMLLLPNYEPRLVNTILTLATPHAAAPLTFDGDILKVYSAVDRFWAAGFGDSDAAYAQLARDTLANVSLVSVTGGLLDNTLPADYTTLGFLVPPQNGFTVYTTGVPHVWTPIDHLAIVWCAQLRRVVLQCLLDIVQRHSASKTLALPQRMAVLRRHLLSGFEAYAAQDLDAANALTLVHLKVDLRHLETVPVGGLRTTLARDAMHIFHLDGGAKFSLLLSQQVSRYGAGAVLVLLCRNAEDAGAHVVDLTSASTLEFAALSCVDVHRDARAVPQSLRDSERLTQSSFGGELAPFSALQYSPEVLRQYDAVLVVVRADNGFVVATLSDAAATEVKLGRDLPQLIRRGADVSLAAARPLAVNVNVPGAWSSLLAYRVRVVQRGGGTPLFAPFIRQWLVEPYETKWHINVGDEILVVMHGIAPFTPFRVRPEGHGVNLEVWTDLAHDAASFDLVLSVDYVQSFKLLLLRYRLALVCYCVALTVLSFGFQFGYFCRSGHFPTMVYGLSMVCLAKVLGAIVVVLSLLTGVVNRRVCQRVLSALDPVAWMDPNERAVVAPYKQNSFFLGLEEPYLWVLGPLFLVMAVAIVLATYYILLAVGVVVSTAVRGGRMEELKTPPLLPPPLQSPQPPTLQSLLPPPLRAMRHLFVNAVLLGAIPFFLPYQFAYVVCCVAQAVTTLGLLCTPHANKSALNYHLTMLVLMLWVLPINVPVLVVYVHNLAVNWTTPFLSHHNILAILPVMLLVQRHAGKPLPAVATAGARTTTYALASAFVFYCVVYGIRHTFWLHHMLNIFCCWLLVIFSSNA